MTLAYIYDLAVSTMDDPEAFWDQDEPEETDLWLGLVGPGEQLPAAHQEQHEWFQEAHEEEAFGEGPPDLEEHPALRMPPREASSSSASSNHHVAAEVLSPTALTDPYLEPHQQHVGLPLTPAVLPEVESPCPSTPQRATHGPPNVTPTSPKRRRIREKTNLDAIGRQDLVPSPMAKDELMNALKEHTGLSKLRDLYTSQRRTSLRNQNPTKAAAEILALAREEWAQKPEEWRVSWAQSFLSHTYNCCPLVPRSQYYQHRQQQSENSEAAEIAALTAQATGNHHRFRGCLGTWNGSWLKGKPAWDALVNKGLDDESFIHEARQNPALLDLVQHFEAFCKRRCQKLGFDKYSFQFEASLKAEEAGRVHIHAFWHSSEKRVHPGTAEAWSFLGSQPMLRQCDARGRHAQKFFDRGHFYCQCMKQGYLLRSSNYRKYEHFAVEQKWVIGLWQLRKLDHENAKQEILSARGHTATYIKEITYVQQAEEEAQVREEKRIADIELSKKQKKFRTVLDVELWKLQYSTDPAFGLVNKQPRFKFLVLNGPSCYGKTQYAKAVFGVANTLLVQCQGVKSPCLKDFTRGKHRCIILDECSSEVVVENKTLFQANSDGVLLGQSACNEHAYWKYLYGIALIISCNDWLKGITPDSEAANWLRDNSIVYQVTEKMYIEPGSEHLDGEIEV